MSTPAGRRPRKLSVVLLALSLLGCGSPAAEMERARQAEAEAAKRLEECQAELARTRKALEDARRGAAKERGPDDGAAVADWNAARMVAEVFLEAVNSRNADAANAAGTREFRDKNGGKKALESFSGGRFRGEADGYTCGALSGFEPVPGRDEFLGRGKLLYRGVPRQDSSYSVRVVREDDKWHVASFSAVER